MRFPIEEIWIEDAAADAPLTGHILERLPGVPVFSGEAWVERSRSLVLENDPLARGKRILKLMTHKGAFVKPCPGTPAYVCCGLEILHIGQGCPMDCRYCALQVYFNRPVLEVFVNVDEMMAALSRHLDEHTDRFHRVCTGEFTDSLALDPLTGLARRLAAFFAGRKDASLEIKTKTDSVDSLLDVDPRGRVIVSFSVNAGKITATEEMRASALDRRLAAAVRVQARGYRLGFHFDPIVPLPGWEEEYTAVIDRIFSTVEPSAIAWISLGVLRFVPQLKDTVVQRFGPVPYFHDGFHRGLDGKSRLTADRRIRIYRRLVERIQFHRSDARVYLCMESPYIWQESLGIPMQSDDELATYLNEAVQ
jgi:spore photoproduct lyase